MSESELDFSFCRFHNVPSGDISLFKCIAHVQFDTSKQPLLLSYSFCYTSIVMFISMLCSVLKNMKSSPFPQ